jgi:8-oxo-dGTP pyrophosphatase MutT (NUDIX family)
MPARVERSAGFLIYRQPTGSAEPEFLLLDYGRHWDYPKGHVEEGEDDLNAALRELEEETGITKVKVEDGFDHEMTYFFRKPRKGLVKKTVIFFLGRTDAKKVKLSDEHVAAEFLPFAAALKRVTYPNARKALKSAKAFLDAAGR